MTGCGKNKKIKRVEGPMTAALGFHVGQLCLHSQVCFQSVQIKLVLGLIPSLQ